MFHQGGPLLFYTKHHRASSNDFACSIRKDCILDSRHRPSYHHVRKHVKHHCKRDPFHWSPLGGRLRSPLLVWARGMDVLMEQIGCNRDIFLTFPGHASPPYSVDCSHQEYKALSEMPTSLDEGCLTVISQCLYICSTSCEGAFSLSAQRQGLFAFVVFFR